MKRLLMTSIISLILSILAAKAADFWLSERLAVLGTFAGFQYSLNPGIAWGIRLPSGLQEVLILLALACVGYLASKVLSSKLQTLSYGCILGGGLGNVIDRFLDGYVTDYIQIGSFPIFNVADSFVTIGVTLLFLEAIYTKYFIRNT